ncbi:MAG: VWA domain-containing protein, partial [Planctomycetaceae bacterium]|nr:VWA domain-containing protein [Planctomycetaceae bacterium]
MTSLAFVGSAVRRRRPCTSRRGVIIVLTALLLMFMLGMIAFAVDLGFIANARTEIQRATDAAAYAGAGELVNGTGPATSSAQQYLVANQVGGTPLNSGNATIEYGLWNITNRTFTPTNSTPNAVRVTAIANQQPLFFAKALGTQSFNIQSQSVATYQPRDICLVLDYSRSMCFDSHFPNIDILGKTAVETNMQQIWQDLGSPVYGTLTWTPVAYGNSGTKNNSVIKKFKLDKVAYPFPQGSWSEYVDYVQSDNDVYAAGYRNKYGMLTFIGYLQTYRAEYADTPTLHNTRQQPLTALKDAVDVFLSFLTSHSTDDQVGLSIYSASDGTAVLEQSLTKTYSLISTKVRSRQAGHYTGGTNISAGLQKGRLEVQNNARAGAKKMIVLMTDGVPTLPSGSTSTNKQSV